MKKLASIGLCYPRRIQNLSLHKLGNHEHLPTNFHFITENNLEKKYCGMDYNLQHPLVV